MEGGESFEGGRWTEARWRVEWGEAERIWEMTMMQNQPARNLGTRNIKSVGQGRLVFLAAAWRRGLGVLKK